MIAVAYFAEVLKKARDLPYVLLTILLAAIPVILGWVLFKRDSLSQLLKRGEQTHQADNGKLPGDFR